MERKREVGVWSEPDMGEYTAANMYVDTQWISVTTWNREWTSSTVGPAVVHADLAVGLH